MHSFIFIYIPISWQHGTKEIALKEIGSTNPGSRIFGFDLDKFQNITEPQDLDLKVGIIIHSTSKNDF